MKRHVCLLSSAQRQEITVSIILISDMLMALLKADSLKNFPAIHAKHAALVS
jgi:hypothetical protein